jgi:hypothetical protein
LNALLFVLWFNDIDINILNVVWVASKLALLVLAVFATFTCFAAPSSSWVGGLHLSTVNLTSWLLPLLYAINPVCHLGESEGSLAILHKSAEAVLHSSCPPELTTCCLL